PHRASAHLRRGRDRHARARPARAHRRWQAAGAPARSRRARAVGRIGGACGSRVVHGLMTPERFQRAWVRPVRLWGGLILFSYLVTHFSNHALGLVSLNAMEQARIWFLALWRNPLSETALFGALLAHWLLGLWLLYRRRTLRMPAWEAIQIVFGLAVPPLLAYHLAGTRLPNAMFDTTDLYSRTILNLVQDPWASGRTSALFLIAWVHGCIGLHFWLRLRSWYARMFPLVLMGFVLLPVLASLGIAMAGREVAALAQEPGFAKRLLAETRSPQGAQRLELQQI